MLFFFYHIMKYNFDEVIDRRGTGTYKYGELKNLFGREDLLPLWVADMDFATPPFIVDALKKRLEHPVFGYTMPDPEYWQVVCKWIEDHHGWKTQPEWMTFIPGIVKGIGFVVNVFLKEDEKVIIQPPVYHPFRIVPMGNDREIVWNHLVRTETSIAMDLDALRQDLKGVKMMILCNPHNPAGKCWDLETLREVAHICHEEGVIVVSDEIHCDMLLGDRKHIPFATVSEEARQITITLQAPTKTYNLPGVVCSHAIVTDPTLREKYFGYIQHSDMDLGNIFAFDCASACYSEEGDEWRKQMLTYVEGNIDCLTEGLAKITDKIKVIRPEASFLVFLDCRGLGFKTQTECTRFFADKCQLCLNPGEMFGPGGRCYMRMNVGCPRSVVEQALAQIAEGISSL